MSTQPGVDVNNDGNTSNAPEIANNNHEGNSSDNPTSDNANGTNEMTNSLFMRFSTVCKPFGLPSIEEIAVVALQYFNDPFMTCVTQRLGSEIIYRFEFSEPVTKLGHSLKFNIRGQGGYSIPLYYYERSTRGNTGGTRGQGRGRKYDDTMLITFKFAATGELSTIDNKYFDNLISSAPLNFEVTKPTELQKYVGTEMFNGGRYCVIKIPKSLNEIPDSIPMIHPVTKRHHQIKITYKNQERKCGRCMKKHVGECQELKDFYAAKAKREDMEIKGDIKTKIFGDSTVRNMNALGLTADVCAMSGGGIGQILQAAGDDPDALDKENIVIIGGANDIKNDHHDSNREFAIDVNRSMDKLKELAEGQPEKRFVVVNSLPDKIPGADNVSDVRIKQEYLHAKVETVVEKWKNDDQVKNVECISVVFNTDETGHPSLEGTTQIINQLDQYLHLSPPMIWNEKFITASDKYRGVQPIYRYGCNNCQRFGSDLSQNIGGLTCNECIQEIKVLAGTEELELLDEITKRNLENRKRERSDDEEEEDDEERKKRAINDDDESTISQQSNDGSEITVVEAKI